MKNSSSLSRTLLGVCLLAGLLISTSAGASSPSPPPPSVEIDDPCYPGSALDDIPDLDKPPKENWRHIITPLFVLMQGPPYHMVHDAVAPPWQEQIMVGKFDYGAVTHKDLEDERVHVYIYGTGQADWEYVGTWRTNYDGKIYARIPGKDVGEYIVKMIVAGDLSEAYGWLTVVDPGRDVVVFDIDGTLTINDLEILGDYTGCKDAEARDYAPELVSLYKQKGYQIVYLTGRPYPYAKDTRDWFNMMGFPDTNSRFTLTLYDTLLEVEQYKTEFLLELRDEVGVNLFRAYGNATSDIDAYENAGIPKENTFIIGDNAGMDGTMAIEGDYESHYNWVVDTLGCGN